MERGEFEGFEESEMELKCSEMIEGMPALSRDFVFLLLQFLDDDEKFKETIHTLEQESGFYFNMKYFEEEVLNGNWDNVEKYLGGFTKVGDNRFSVKLFFEIRKQKYLEALDKSDRAKAVEILVKDLKGFVAFSRDTFKEITQLITLENFREHEHLSNYPDTKSAREIVLVELKKLIKANPMFSDKLQFPTMMNTRLRTLINQSLNWQHYLCKYPRPDPDIKTLYANHSCGQPNSVTAPPPADNPLIGSIPRTGGFSPMDAHGPAAPVPIPPAGCMLKSPAAAHPAVAHGTIGFGAATSTVMPTQPRAHPAGNPSMDYTADSDHVTKSTRPVQISEEINLSENALPATYLSQAKYINISEDMTKTVARTLSLGSTPMSMDFHPIVHTFLLVGTNVADIGLWEVASNNRMVLRKFEVWKLEKCTTTLQTSLLKDPTVSVNRVIWSPDGSMFGVAYSRHIVQIYTYHGGKDIRQHLEIDAHVGSVNDIAFAHPKGKLCVITCGDDMTIKVWDATNGTRQFIFEEHGAPVFSICPHNKENTQFLMSTALDGKIKAWLYDDLGCRLDYDAPGHWCTTMAYTVDGTRLFSCGTSKEGESFLVEWNDGQGTVKRTYQGFSKRSLGIVQFDTSRNRFLAAGDEFVIKFWDMNNTNLLATNDAEGGLPVRPKIRFNKKGSLLAVSTQDNGIKILANGDGLELLHILKTRFDAVRTVAEAVPKPQTDPFIAGAVGPGSGARERPVAPVDATAMIGDGQGIGKPRIADESMDKSKTWKITDISPAQCRSLSLMNNSRPGKISGLTYTNSGVALLALTSKGIHLLWKWSRDELNPKGKATASISPQLWQPASGILMTNDVAGSNLEAAVHCFALSKNDRYVISASGGKISLFNLVNSKNIKDFMFPPPAATFIAFHPEDNNVIAIGMEDSTIRIYNVKTAEVKRKLKGHSKKITGLAFSSVLNLLVSSDADAQICTWGTNLWKKQRSIILPMSSGNPVSKISDTRVQFHIDKIHFLAVHETQIAIYNANFITLKPTNHWALPCENAVPITDATFSCDGQLIYAAFMDATVCIFNTSNLQPRCRIFLVSYLPPNVSASAHPVVIAAHTSEPDQFALGLTDGSVHVLEPLESGGNLAS